jgi:hypothetical protein
MGTAQVIPGKETAMAVDKIVERREKFVTKATPNQCSSFRMPFIRLKWVKLL